MKRYIGKFLFVLLACMPAALSCSDAETASVDYGVSYDANGAAGGAVPVDPHRYQTGATVTVLSNSGGLYGPSGLHIFDGWRTTADESGTRYLPGATFAMGQSNVTLYAIWEYLGPL